MKRRYSRAYDPPAPVVTVRVAAPGSERSTIVEAKVDTGADICTLPEAIVLALDLPAVRVVRALGFAGEPIRLNVHLSDFHIGGVALDLVEAVPTRRHYALLGRNALRKLVVTLDGPKSEIEMHAPESRPTPPRLTRRTARRGS